MSSTISSKDFLPMDSSDSKTRKRRDRRDRRDREMNRTHTTGSTESKIKEILEKAEARVVSIAKGNLAAKSKPNANDKFENPKSERYETIDLESGKVDTTQSLPAHARARPGTRGVSTDKRTPRASHKNKMHHHRSKSRPSKGDSPKVRETKRTKKKDAVAEKKKDELELEGKASQQNIVLKEVGLDDDEDESASLGYYKWAPVIVIVSIFTVILIYILIANLVDSDNDVYCITNIGGSQQYTTNKILCEEEPGYNENTVSLNSTWEEGAV